MCDEGWRGRGNGASVLRIVPYSALHFSAYESYRQALAEMFSRQAGVPEAEFHVTPAVDLLAGSAAGATAVLVRAAGAVHVFLALGLQATCMRSLPLAQTPALPTGSSRAPWPAQVTYPLDLVRTRLAYDVEGRAPAAAASPATAGARIARAAARRGIVGVLAETVRAEGVLGLYRGIGPTMLGILPYAGLKFYVYQSLKAEYRRWAPCMPPAHRSN